MVWFEVSGDRDVILCDLLLERWYWRGIVERVVNEIAARGRRLVPLHIDTAAR